MKALRQTYHIKAPVAEVWDALVNPKSIDAWGGGPDVAMDDKEGTEFSLWEGDIYGKNITVKKDKLLVQEWFGGNWDQPSEVTFILHKEKNGTKLEMLQEKIPDSEVDDIEEGWEDYYLGPMKHYLEKRN